MKRWLPFFIIMFILVGCDKGPVSNGTDSDNQKVSLHNKAADSDAVIHFGVQAPRGELNAILRWSDFGHYLQREIGQSVKIVPLKPNNTVAKMRDREVDLMLGNPALSVVMNSNGSSYPIATMNKKSGHYLAGVIIAKKGSGIKNAKDLVGKRVMGFKFKKSAAAYIFQVKHLLDEGVDAHKDFQVFEEATKQDHIVTAVLDGSTDAGFIKSGLLETLAAEGKISLGDFEIVDKKSDEMPLLHSTTLYPSWTVMAGRHLDESVVNKIKTALLNVHNEKTIAKLSKIKGFIEPASLAEIGITLKQLGLMPASETVNSFALLESKQ